MKTKKLAVVVKRFIMLHLLLPGLLLILAAALVIFYHETRQARIRQSCHVRMISTYAHTYLQKAEEDLNYLASLVTGGYDGEDLSEIFEPFIIHRSLYSRIMILDERGLLLDTYPEDRRILDLSGLITVDEPSVGMSVTPPYYSTLEEEIVVGLVWHTAMDETIVVELNLEELQNFILSHVDSSETGFSFLTDGYGNVLAHPDMGLVARQVNFGYLDILSKRADDQVRTELEQWSDGWYLMSAVTLPGGSWNVVVADRFSSLFGPTLLLLLIGGSFFLLLVVVLNFAAVRSLRSVLTQPITQFTRLVEDFQKQDRRQSSRNSLPRIDADFEELKSLRDAFMTMSDAVIRQERELREREQNLNATLHSIGEGVIVCDLAGRVNRINDTALRITGWQREAAIGTPVTRVFPLVDGRTGDPADDPVAKVLRSGEVVGLSNSTTLKSKRGEEYRIADSAAPIKGDDGKMLGVIVVFRDVTEKYRRDQEIREALREKETLLQEIHHRVKNNLNIVSSLLTLQADSVESAEDAKKALLESRNRVYSMAMIHEDLYSTEDMTRVDMSFYISNLVRELSNFYQKAEVLDIHTEVQDLQLDITRAVPCGIILNELVTNAMKHGLTGEGRGEVWIRLSKKEEELVELAVCDSGPGMPEDFDLGKNESLGLQLVSVLARQLDGDLSIQSGERTCFLVRFPCGEALQHGKRGEESIGKAAD